MASSELGITINIPRNVLIKNDNDDIIEQISTCIQEILDDNREETGDVGDINVCADGWS